MNQAHESFSEARIILQLGGRAVDLLSKGYAIELVEDDFIEAFDNAVRLRALCLRSGVINIFDRESRQRK